MQKVLKQQKTENKTSIRYLDGLNLWILAAVFVANIFFQLSEVSSSIFMYVGTLIMIVPLLFLDKDDYIYVFVSLLSVIRFSTIFDVSVINLITIIYFFRTYITGNEFKKEKDKRRLPKNTVTACVVFIMYSLQYILNGTQALRMSFIAIKLMFFLVYMVDVFRSCTDRKTGAKRFMNIQVYYVIGVLIAVFTSILVNPAYSLDATRMSLAEGAGVNQLGITLAFCLVFVTMGMTKVTNYKEWICLAGVALPLLYYCFATQSRTSLIGMIITFAAVLTMGYSQPRARKWITFMAVGSVAVLGGLILFTEGSQLHENIMGTIERFTDPRGNDISNGRFDLWARYVRIFTTNARLFFFGGPLESYGNIQAHNMFLEIFALYGIVGAGIIAWMYTALFIDIKNSVVSLGKGKFRLLSLLPMAVLFITGMASHTLLNTEPSFFFCMGVAMIYFYGENDLDENTLADNDDSGAEPLAKRKGYKNFRRLGNSNSKKFRRV
ncbi:MAG: O-antigen ligase family protein [Clostridia bacterium]|nr:O-antigen ligase family protein [Clostridia bacterium]